MRGGWRQEGHGRYISLQEKALGLANKLRDRGGSGEESSGRGSITFTGDKSCTIRGVNVV